MKHLLWLFLTASLAVRAIGQSNAPVRLAVIVDSEEIASPGNVLTFELSRNPQVVLLERSEIQKVYREQGLSAENKNYVKFGQVLGADGLCLLEITRTGMQTNLSVRVVAVKPGVVLANENFAWPIDNVLDWAASTADHLKPLLPKLSVMVKDAIPLSVVNLRSAVASKEATEMERQLKLLTIQRLSHEPQFFVLERQKMQLLSDEKSLKGIDDSAFWSGSYLLEGVLDQDGYSENTVTINARLTPAKGGAPLLFEVKGSRTNLTEVVNLLALKISELLNANSMGSEWNPGDEAAQYFAEANWALRWGILSEAQMASDSAWALGKQDLECASARIKAYLPEVTSGMYDFAHSSYLVDGRRDVAGAMRRVTDELHQQYAAFVFNIHDTTLDSVGLVKPPPPESIDRPIKTLALYEDLSHALADQLRSTNGAAVAAAGTWHALGVADLTAAAKVLQRFHFVPGSEKPVAEKLAELRAEARAVDRLISDDYCDVQWGCFWQETPEECLSLYHHLLANPDFWRIHDEFWIRQPEQPRLTAWNAKDRTRIPELWNHFVQDLNESTNVLWRMEAQVLTFADASDKIAKDTAFTNLVNLVSAHREELRRNPSRPFSRNWGFNALFLKYSSYYEFYEANLRPQLSSIDLDYHTKTVPEMTEASLFQEQKQYLAANTILEHSNYVRLFFAEKFSKAQALELQPLAAAYKSNLVAQSQVSVAAWTKLQLALSDAFSLAYNINHTIDPSLPTRLRWEGSPLRPGGRPVLTPSTNRATASHLTTTPSVETPDLIHKPVRVARETNSETAAETNVIVVNKFVELPLTGPQGEHRSFLKITSHQLDEGKLLLDFTYASDAAIPANGPAELRTYEQPSGIAIFDPATEHLDSISCPRFDVAMANPFHYCTTLFRGEVYHSDGARISRFDRKTQKWEVLPISNGINYELFNVADHLYAADDSTIFEIVDSGKSNRLLCSTRRNPPVTLLDRQNLGTPILTEGPNHSLRVIGKDKTFILANNDWVEEGKAPQHSWTPQIFPEGVLFRYHPGGLGQPDHLSYLAVATNSPELLLLQQGRVQKNLVYNPDQYKRINAALIQAPLWSKPKGLALAKLPAAIAHSDLYLLADHSQSQDMADSTHLLQMHKISPKDNYHAALLHFSSDSPEPQTVLLKFDSSDGCPPATGVEPKIRPLFPYKPPVWMLFGGQFLILGIEKVEGGIQPEINHLGVGYKTGFWLLPLSQLEPEMAAQKNSQIAQTAITTRQTGKQALLAKYDKDHNGLIEGDEKEAALGDWDFLESQLNIIDSNRNHRLGANELAYFDANGNGVLDPNEEAAIYAVQELLAVKLSEEADRDEDGEIDQAEFFAMMGEANFNDFGTFHKVKATSEAEQLEIFFRNRLKESLDPDGYEIPGGWKHGPHIPTPPTFKGRVENYWSRLKARPIAKKP